MELRKVVSLLGPNIWAPCPMLEAWVELEAFSGLLSRDVPGFDERLTTWLPLLPDPADLGGADELLARLQAGLPLAEVLQALALRLQRAGGRRMAVRRGFALATGAAGQWRVAVEFEEESLAQRALASAWRMLLAATGRGDYDPASELAQLRAFVDRYCLGPSTRAIVEAARKRQIPARRLDDGSLVQLGQGIHQRRMFTAETDRTSIIAEGIAQDKELTKSLLRAAGVPVPEGRIVTAAADAWQAACEIGFPVVVKPRDANHGRGVALNLQTREQIEAAYALAVDEGSGVMVERCARGAEHRLLIVGDRLVAASRGEPDLVIGDGENTVSELVDRLNRDPRRGFDFTCPLGIVELDPPGLFALEQQGYRPDSVPLAGTTVIIHANGDYTTDETDEVHPDVAAQAVSAAQVIGLDVAGIDVIAGSIGRPLREQGGMVIEVNAGPGLNMHLSPQRGQPRPVGEAIVELLFPPGLSGRVPLAVVCCRRATIIVRLVAGLLRAAGYCVGSGDRDGVSIDERRLTTIEGGLPEQQRTLLLHPRLTAAVFESPASTILEGGLAFELCDVAIIGPPADELDQSAIATAAHVGPGALERVLAGTVGSQGYLILWADDPLAEQTAAASRGGTIWLAQDGNHPQLIEARRRGGRVAFRRDGIPWFATAEREWPLVPDDRRSILQGLESGFDWETLLAATAAGWGLGLADDVLATGLSKIAAAGFESTNGHPGESAST